MGVSGVALATSLSQIVGFFILLAIARQGLFFIPTLWLMSWLFGIFGVQASQAMADLLSFALAVPIGPGVLRQFKQMKEAAANADIMAE